MRRSEPCALRVRHKPVQQSLNYLGLQHTDFQIKWSGGPCQRVDDSGINFQRLRVHEFIVKLSTAVHEFALYPEAAHYARP